VLPRNLEKLNSLESSKATINAEVREIQLDQDTIDQLDGTDDDTAIERRNRMIEGVELKLTQVNILKRCQELSGHLRNVDKSTGQVGHPIEISDMFLVSMGGNNLCNVRS
jgi:hypothetical protein